ncbi:MAG: YIP1 family protein [Nanoarchaeota archaeon]
MAKSLFTDPIKKYQLLFTKAEQFYKKVQAEKEYQDIALYLLGFVFVGEILSFVAWLPTLGLGIETAVFAIAMGVLGIILSPILTLLATFIGAGIVHLCLMLFKKGLDYFTTWKVVAYASLIPIIYNIASSIITTFAESLNPWPEQSLLAAEPVFGTYSITVLVFMFIIGFASLIHALYTEVVGLRLYHKITTGQAVGALALSFVVILVLFLLFVLFVFVARTVVA